MISENLRGRKIMGGFGNGKRYGSKDTTSSYKRLDFAFCSVRACWFRADAVT